MKQNYYSKSRYTRYGVKVPSKIEEDVWNFCDREGIPIKKPLSKIKYYKKYNIKPDAVIKDGDDTWVIEFFGIKNKIQYEETKKLKKDKNNQYLNCFKYFFIEDNYIHRINEKFSHLRGKVKKSKLVAGDLENFEKISRNLELKQKARNNLKQSIMKDIKKKKIFIEAFKTSHIGQEFIIIKLDLLKKYLGKYFNSEEFWRIRKLFK